VTVTAEAILDKLHVVAYERARRLATPKLQAQVTALKAFQQNRFARTYADLLLSPRYSPAARFFLAELYGPSDFTHRDAQVARVVPALVRIFPSDIVQTVAQLAALHALSEQLDTAIGEALLRFGDDNGDSSSDSVSPINYIQAWQATGQAEARAQQITLTLSVATRLDQLTRKPLLSHSLRLMRGPAKAAGLGDLQQFLETGFETFRAMKGSQEFMSIVSAREHSVVAALFGGQLHVQTADPLENASLALALAALPPAPPPSARANS
jgi:hypothetical protein